MKLRKNLLYFNKLWNLYKRKPSEIIEQLNNSKHEENKKWIELRQSFIKQLDELQTNNRE